MRVKKKKVSAVEDSPGVEVPLWWTGFGEQETRPNSKVGIESRERVTFTPPTPLTPSTKAALKKKKLESSDATAATSNKWRDYSVTDAMESTRQSAA